MPRFYPGQTDYIEILNTLVTSINPTFTGGIYEGVLPLSGTIIDVSSASYFTKTIFSPTSFSLSNIPPSGIVCSFILELTNAGSYAITWFPGCKWAGGIAPTLSTGVDVLGFYTSDGGVTWRAFLLAKDSK